MLIADAPRFRSAGFGTGVSPWTYLLNQAVMIGTYLKLSIWPHPLVLDYGRTQPIALRRRCRTWCWSSCCSRWWQWHGYAGAASLAYLGLWFFLTLAPSSSVVPIATEVGAERRMHLALAAVMAAIVLGARAAAARWPADSWLRRPGVAPGAVAVVALLLVATPRRATASTRSGRPVGRRARPADPTGARTTTWRSRCAPAGRSEEAMAHYRAAMADEPAAHYAVGFELGRAGRFDEAERELAEYMARAPEGELVPSASFLRGQALVRLGGRRTPSSPSARRSGWRLATPTRASRWPTC